MIDIERLHASPFKGVFHEVGVGIEVTASLLRVPGASHTVIGSRCDYAGKGKPDGMRAVSLEYAKYLAGKCYLEALSTLEDHEPLHNIFGMAVTAADYSDKPSHAWVCIYRHDSVSYMHISNMSDNRTLFNRAKLGSFFADEALAFLDNILFQETPWNEYCQNLHEKGSVYRYVDVIYSPGISDIERLLTLGEDRPLVFFQGKFHRVVDFLRKYDIIYGGSFNPPHPGHITAGKGALFLLSTGHCYKNNLSLEDTLHRLRMLDIYGVPILVTKGTPMFWQKHKLLKKLWNKDYIYRMGVDAWNAMIAPHQYPDADFMREHFSDGTVFAIMARDGYTMEQNIISHDLNVVDAHIRCEDFSSTHIRAGVSDGMPKEILDYININGLYKNENSN